MNHYHTYAVRYLSPFFLNRCPIAKFLFNLMVCFLNIQGPALYAYNDAMFTDKDWKGIGLMGKSLKDKDPIKIGRFGLGFKSVFHLSG